MASKNHPRRSRAHPGWWLVGGVLIAFWFVVMGLMFWPGQDLASAFELSFSGEDLKTPEDEWLGAYSAGQKLGFVHSSSQSNGKNILIHQDSQLRLKVGAGPPQLIQSNLELHLEQRGALESFGFTMQAGSLKITSHGQVTLEGLSVELTIAGETLRKTLPLTAKPVFDVALPRMLARQDLRPGRRFQITLFDPQALSNQPTLIEVLGRDAINVDGRLVASIRLRRTQPSRTQPNLKQVATEQDIWIDEDGRLLQENISLGLVLRRESEATATTGIAADGVPLPHWLPFTLPQSIMKDAK